MRCYIHLVNTPSNQLWMYNERRVAVFYIPCKLILVGCVFGSLVNHWLGRNADKVAKG